MKTVDVLFARKDSIYKTFPECDVWDAERDVRNYELTGRPVICHPPCRIWSRFWKRSLECGKYDPMEHMWPWWCIDLIDRYGGVLEHPVTSKLWKKHKPFVVDQYWFGHRAQKRTGLYINGNVPPYPFKLGIAEYKVVSDAGYKTGLRQKYKRIKPSEIDQTPPDFAKWLIEAVT